MTTDVHAGSLQLRIDLLDVRPAVWRRVVVPTSISMGELAQVILISMGWDDAHLHQFRVGNELYGIDDKDAPEEQIDEDEITVAAALEQEAQFFFDYDFGDGWEHQVVVEDRSPTTVDFAECLDGENACPPDDVGGPWGYHHFLQAMRDPEHNEHEYYVEWFGGSFDPSFFDRGETNAELRQLH